MDTEVMCLTELESWTAKKKEVQHALALMDLDELVKSILEQHDNLDLETQQFVPSKPLLVVVVRLGHVVWQTVWPNS